VGSPEPWPYVIRATLFYPELPAVISEDRENSGNSRTVIVSQANNINLTKPEANDIFLLLAHNINLTKPMQMKYSSGATMHSFNMANELVGARSQHNHRHGP